MQTPLVLTLGLVFLSVALTAGAFTAYVLTYTSSSRKRLMQVTRETVTAPLPAIVSLSSRAESSEQWRRIESVLPRSEKEMARLRARLDRAGIRAPGSAAIYTLIEFTLPVVAGLIPFAVLPVRTAALLGGASALLSFFLPGILVEQRLAKRRREIENGLPDALDLLVVCIEAGSGIDQALVKTADELTLTYPSLADELRLVTVEVRAGKPRMEAFKSFASRTKVDDVRALVAMLIQTDRFGTSIGQALRTHADVSRTRRRQRAEERAAKIGVKLVFPLVLCFFPAFYVVVLGPAVIEFMRVFAGK